MDYACGPMRNKRTRLSYDTTFELADCYASGLTFRDTTFVEQPVSVPVVALHKTREMWNHIDIFSIIKYQTENIDSLNTVIVVYREPGILAAIRLVLPNISIVYCWNHLKHDVRDMVAKLHGKMPDKIGYKTHLEELLSATTKDDYLKIEQ